MILLQCTALYTANVVGKHTKQPTNNVGNHVITLERMRQKAALRIQIRSGNDAFNEKRCHPGV